MTIWTIALIIIIVGPWLFELVVDKLNLDHNNELPEELKDVYDEEKYQKQQLYLKDGTRFGFISSTFSVVLTMLFIFCGGYRYLDEFIRQYSDNDYLLGLLFIGIITIAGSILEIPFKYYTNFVIEEKYGFNKMTLGLFIKDNLLSLLLTALIGIPLLLALMWIFNLAEQHPFAWLYAWVFITAFFLAMYFLMPTIIMPLFNKFEPIEDGELNDAIMGYAKKENFALGGVFKTDGSKRSTKANAFFTGIGKGRRIVLFDTLIDKHTVPELLIVLAHEMGHFKLKHIVKQMVLTILFAGLILFLIQFLMTNTSINREIFKAFQMGESHTPSVYASMVFIMMIVSPLNLVFGIVRNYLSRKFEFEADAYAAETCGNPQDLINALKRLSGDQLSNLTPHPLKVFLEYSHPTIWHRIQALKQYITE